MIINCWLDENTYEKEGEMEKSSLLHKWIRRMLPSKKGFSVFVNFNATFKLLLLKIYGKCSFLSLSARGDEESVSKMEKNFVNFPLITFFLFLLKEPYVFIYNFLVSYMKF